MRDIQAQLSELYGTEISPDLISSVTDEVLGEVQAWQIRPLDAIWPIVYLDALVIVRATRAWSATSRPTSRWAST